MNKTIVVSGGSRGIGRAIVEKFASNGFAVITSARNKSNLLDLENKAQQHHWKVKTFVADLGKQKEVFSFIDFVLQEAKTVDLLVNNVGQFIPGKLEDEADGVLEQMMAVNLYSAYYLTRGLLSSIKKSKGSIFNICSVASLKAYPNGGSYCITKHALSGFSKTLREELKNDCVKVTSVFPGATLTDSWSGIDLPKERFIKSEDIAQSIWDTYHLSENTVIEELLIRPQLGDI